MNLVTCPYLIGILSLRMFMIHFGNLAIFTLFLTVPKFEEIFTWFDDPDKLEENITLEVSFAKSTGHDSGIVRV